MSRLRLITLVVGPVLLVAASYFATWTLFAATASVDGNRLDDRIGDRSPAINRSTAETADPLAEECHRTAEGLRMRLDVRFTLIVRPPFVIAGNLSDDQLDEYHRDTMLPTQRALSIQYFDRAPERPIVVLLLRDDDSYRELSREFDGLHRDCYAGYYIRNERRIVVNVSTGNGTLAHELTHALAHADCERLPEWFDEGFASLFEQSEFTDDGLQLLGLPNWRIHYLAPALKRNRLPSLETMLGRGDIRTGHEGLDYAMARYFCLFLQERDLLAPYYRKLRSAAGNDAGGGQTLLQLLHEDDFAAIAADFGAWLRSTYKAYVER